MAINTIGKFPALVHSASKVEALEATTANQYTTLPTVDSVTLETSSVVLVILTTSGYSYPDASQSMTVSVSGATDIEASDSLACTIKSDELTTGSVIKYLKVNPGINTFTAYYKSSNGSIAHFSNREIIVIDLGV